MHVYCRDGADVQGWLREGQRGLCGDNVHVIVYVQHVDPESGLLVIKNQVFR
jgi:hypothetical protein